MVKNEIKIELSNSETLKSIFEKAYFEEGIQGKIIGKNHYITILPENDTDWTIFKGLNNVTVKITNEIIDGAARFLIDDTHDTEIRLYPISIYCIKEEDRYIFY